MNKNIKNINKFLLYLAGFIIVLHAIIPHDHHYTSGSDINHQNEIQHETDDELPMHCYTFNDGFFDKSESLNFKFDSSINIFFFCISSVNVFPEINEIIEFYYIKQNIVLYRQYFLADSFLRGPPLIS